MGESEVKAETTLKDQGNEFFKAGNYLKAAALYTQAIKKDPSNGTLYRFIFTIIQLHFSGNFFFFQLCVKVVILLVGFVLATPLVAIYFIKK